MNTNGWIRQSHRWVSMVFVVTVVANFIALAMGHMGMWLNYLPLPPLFYLMGTGLYMFARPYLKPKPESLSQ
jgi:hypothetical protein